MLNKPWKEIYLEVVFLCCKRDSDYCLPDNLYTYNGINTHAHKIYHSESTVENIAWEVVQNEFIYELWLSFRQLGTNECF